MLVATPKEIGILLAAIRRSRHIRQADLAARVGVSRQWLVDLEHGKPSVSLGLSLRTCATLGFSLDMSSLDPVPSWQTAIIAHGEEKFWRLAQQRRRRRNERRQAAAARRLAAASARKALADAEAAAGVQLELL